MLRVTTTFDVAEGGALVTMAETDCRDPREQLRWLLVKEARRRGLLRASGTATEPTNKDRAQESQRA